MDNQTIRDQVAGSLPQHELRQAAFAVISRTQNTPSIQVVAMATALLATCKALDIDVRSLLETTERRINDLDGPFTTTFAAITEYARGEIGNR